MKVWMLSIHHNNGEWSIIDLYSCRELALKAAHRQKHPDEDLTWNEVGFDTWDAGAYTMRIEDYKVKGT